MMLGTSARGPLAPDAVWERYARPERCSERAPQIRSVDASERLVEGGTGRVDAVLGVRSDFVVDTWDETEREWSWTVHTRLPRGIPALHRLVH